MGGFVEQRDVCLCPGDLGESGRSLASKRGHLLSSEEVLGRRPQEGGRTEEVVESGLGRQQWPHPFERGPGVRVAAQLGGHAGCHACRFVLLDGKAGAGMRRPILCLAPGGTTVLASILSTSARRALWVPLRWRAVSTIRRVSLCRMVSSWRP